MPAMMPALGRFQHGLGKYDHLPDHFLLTRKVFVELLFQHLLETEPFGDAEGHGRHRHDRKHGVKRQRRCPQHTGVFPESPNGQQQDTQHPDKNTLPGRHIGQARPPDITGNELNRSRQAGLGSLDGWRRIGHGVILALGKADDQGCWGTAYAAE